MLFRLGSRGRGAVLRTRSRPTSLPQAVRDGAVCGLHLISRRGNTRSVRQARRPVAAEASRSYAGCATRPAQSWCAKTARGGRPQPGRRPTRSPAAPRVPVEHLVADEARRCADVPGRVARSYHALTKALYESAQPYKDARCDARVELEGVEIEGGMCHATNQMFVWPSNSGSSSQAMGGRTFEWSSDSLQMKHVE